MRDAKAIVEELRKYDESLYQKPRWLVLNKVDLLPEDEREKTGKKFMRSFGWKGKSFIISAITGEGCSALTYAIMDYLEEESAKHAEQFPAPVRLNNRLNLSHHNDPEATAGFGSR